MTTRNALQGEPRSACEAVSREGLHGIGRTRRMKPARPAGNWTEQELIPAHEHDAEAHRPGHRRLPIAAQFAQGGVKVGREGGKRGVVRLPTGNRDDVERWGLAARISRPAPEQLSQPPLRTIARHGAAQPPRRDDAQPIAAAGVGPAEQRDKSCRDPSAARLHRGELPTMTQTRIRRKRFGQLRGLGRNRETLTPLGATALEHRAAVLGSHPDKKAVRAATPAAVGLKSTLHDARGTPAGSRRIMDRSQPEKGRQSPIRERVCQARMAVVDSPAFRNETPTGQRVFHICGKTCGNRRVLGMSPVNPSVYEGLMVDPGVTYPSFRP